jgi:hypothetical protein
MSMRGGCLSAFCASGLLLCGVGVLRAQEEKPREQPAPQERPVHPDSLPADSARALPEGVEILPDSMRVDFPAGREREEEQEGEETKVDEEKRVPGFPPTSTEPDSGYSFDAREWNRDEILTSNATSLVGFLTDVVPGFTPIRANYFNGVHQLTDGLFGAGFVRILVDGRDLPPLESGETDLVRIPLVHLDKVRVRRSSTGLTIEIFTRRQHEPDAYGRFGGGTGTPKLDLVHGIFANGWGQAVTIAGAVDLLNVNSGDLISDRLDFWASIAFMPGSNRTGFQLQFKNQTINRTADERLQQGRRDLVFTARREVSPGLIADLALSSNRLTLADSQLVEVNRAGVTLTANPRWGFVRGSISYQGGGAAFPRVGGVVAAGARVGGFLGVDVEVDGSTWEAFDAASIGGGLALGPFTPVKLVLRAGGATGRRGVSRPITGEADSVAFDAFTGSLRLELGPYQLGGRLSRQSVSRQLPFGAPFDLNLQPGPGVDITAFEGELSGPLIPLGGLIRGANPFTISGFWRHQSAPADVQAFYLPADVARGRVGFSQPFFKGDLLVDLGLAAVYRSEMLTSAPGVPNPVPVQKLTRLNLDFLIKIKDFRIFLRLDNLDRKPDEDIVGFPYPNTVTIFGVKWEFFN